MKKSLILLFFVVAVSLALSACSSETSKNQETQDSETSQEENNGSQNESNNNNNDEKVSIDFWALSGQKDTYEPIIEDFMKEYPNIEVKMSTKATEGHKEGIKVAASSGTLPTVWFNFGGSLASFFPENGLSLDLTDYAEKDNWDEKFQNTALNLSTFEDQLAGVPSGITGLAIYYRKDIFEQYGLEEPTTFDEFESIMSTLKDNDITPIAVGGKYGWHTMRFTELVLEHFAGSDLKDKLISLEESWDNEAVKKTYEKLHEWNEKGYFPEGFITIDPDESRIPFYGGQAAMILEGAWFDGVMEEDEFDYLNKVGVFAMPTDQPTTRISSFGDMLQINNKATEVEQEAAIKFALYTTREDVVEKHKNNMSFPQPRPDANAFIPDKQPHAKEISEFLDEDSFLITDQALPQEIVTKFFEAQDKIITGELSTDEAIELMNNSVEEYKGN